MNEEKVIEMVAALGNKFEEALKDGRITPAEAVGVAVAIISLLIRIFAKQKAN